jgi:hypothetical protein
MLLQYLLPVILNAMKRIVLVETCCLVNMINTNINESYVDGQQALPYCQSVILPIHLFSLAVSTVTQPATYS